MKTLKRTIRSVQRTIQNFFVHKKVLHLYPVLKTVPLMPGADEEHLRGAMEWMCHAQDVTGCDGVSAYYDLAHTRWGKPYRETTGYIIETFVEYYRHSHDETFLRRAKKMADWELAVMGSDGAVGEPQKNGSIQDKIFNAGQVLLGLADLYKETNEEAYLQGAIKTADWIVRNQDTNGEWNKFSTNGSKTIDTRVAWALLKLYVLNHDEKYKTSALQHLDWVMSVQKENFWFDKTSFTEVNAPWTHMIAYTISGLLECYLLLPEKNPKVYASFYGAASAMLECYESKKTKDGFLPCTFDEDWNSKDTYSCLTGDAQLALVWMQLYQMTDEKKFLDGAVAILEDVKSTQILDCKEKEIRGGIAGSFPLGGAYAPFFLINWAPKFFADALLYKKRISS